MTKAQSDKLIISYLLHVIPEPDLTDQEYLQTYGGRVFNAIVADFGDGRYLYKSVEDDGQSMGRGRTLYSVIDTNNLADSATVEAGENEMTPVEQNSIIANHLRLVTNEDRNRSDQQVIDEYGGDAKNEIIAAFDSGRYIYRSESSTITGAMVVYSLIDTNDPSHSRTADEIQLEA